MYYSVLFPEESGASLPLRRKAPDCFRDLNLSNIVDAVLKTKKDFSLDGYYYTPVTDADTLRYRQSFLSELEDRELRNGIDSFSDSILFIRTLLDETRKDPSGAAVKGDLLSQGHMLDYAERYCAAVDALSALLDSRDTVSEGLTALKAYLDSYIRGNAYMDLHSTVKALRESFSEVEYCMLIKGNSIRVKKYEGQDDYSKKVTALFDKFRQGAVSDYRIKISESPYASHVETAVLGLLKDLYPDKFAALRSFVDSHMNFDDPTLMRFAAEVQFYIAWLTVTDSLRDKGLSFCIPSFSDGSSMHGTACFDMALALNEAENVVTNDFSLESPERLMVITGPNQGGKTTFARMFGQLHYFAALGLSVPGRSVELKPVREVLTLFQKEEDISTLNGQLQDELERLAALLERAGSDTALVINEIFSSTTADDALNLGRKMMARLTALGAPGVIVTFLDELSAYDESVVSMMSVVTEDEVHERTFKIVRKPADGLAYAINIAHNHGLTYDQLKGRLS